MSEQKKMPPMGAPETQPGKRKHRYAAAQMGGPGGRGPGRGHGPHGGRFGEKVKLKNTKGTIFRMLGYLKHVKLALILAILALLLSTVANLVSPKISGDLIDVLARGVSALQEHGSMPADVRSALGADLLRCIAWMLGLYIASSGFSLAQSLLLTRVSQNTVRAMRVELFDKIQTLPLSYFDKHPRGEMMSRLTNDIDNVSNMLAHTLTNALSSVVTLVVSLTMMLYLSPLLTLVAFLVIPFSMTVVRLITKRTGKLFRAQQAALGEVNGIVEETVTGARVVKVFSRERAVIEDFREANEEYCHAGTMATIFSSCIGPIMNVFNNLSFALMAGIGGFLVVTGSVRSVGMIQSFLQYSRQFQRPLNDMASQITNIQSALAGAERVFEILDSDPEPADEPGADPLSDPKGHVVFDDVTFGYTPERAILKNVSFEALPGQTIALVGPTGAGKTTIVSVLERFYDLNGGSIHIDGKDITNIQRQKLRDSLGMVLQDVYLFAGTIRDNLLYGNLDATEEQMIEAAKMANCHGFISRLPKGYDTELAEDGGNLSQGQRQLLSIARAILSDPKVLILDEATSSVDTRTEVHIQSAMLRLMQGRTSFVIAHRLSTIRHADQILVIDGGEIIERGNHEELMQQQGFYANMLRSQYRASVKAGA
ncbi:MAG: ABC transporter ATP-binding protein [Eubacteriales bacterium]|nr:ABC transporter ATP-binding protein [Eubacteriales bacterium]